MTALSFVGMDALNVAIAARTMPEVMSVQENLWRPARSYPEARRLVGAEPQLVRLVLDDRVLLEHLGVQGIPAGSDLLAIGQALVGIDPDVKGLVMAALGGV